MHQQAAVRSPAQNDPIPCRIPERGSVTELRSRRRSQGNRARSLCPTLKHVSGVRERKDHSYGSVTPQLHTQLRY
jgi:hypothetical protein